MTTRLAYGRDYQGINTDAPDFPTDIQTVTLSDSSGSSVTVPSNYKTFIMYVSVQPNGWCWVSRNGTAAVPSGMGAFASAVSELAAGTREFRRLVYAADVIAFVTPNTTCDIEVCFFGIQP